MVLGNMSPFQVVRDFEAALCEYTGAQYAVTVSSCTAALFLSCKYHRVQEVTIPRRTYVSVPMSIIHAGGRVVFDDRDWGGAYHLHPYPIFDSARRFTSNMYDGGFICVSFHWNKILGIQQGGAILHEDPVADGWFRRARFDGRAEGVAPKDDTFSQLGYHCYMSPEIAAEGLVRLSHLPKHNEDLPPDEYPDLSDPVRFPIFQYGVLDRIEYQRSLNNQQFMKMWKLMAERCPDEFRTIQAEIRKGDMRISALMEQQCG